MGELKIKKPHELAAYRYLRAAIYGGPGVGKSSLAVSAPAPLYIDCDKGVHRMDERHHTDTIDVECWEDVTAILEGNISEFKTLIIDTAGKMMLYINDYLGRVKPSNKQADGSLTQKAYGVRKALFLDFLNRVSKLEKHIIFVCHDKEGKKGENGLYIRPDVGGSSGDDLIRELDLVGYIFISGDQRIITFDPGENFYGKNTLALPKFQKLPDIANGPNLFMTNVIKGFEANAEARSKVKLNYRSIIQQMESDVDAIKTADDANAMYSKMDTYEEVWDSKYMGKKMVVTKVLGMGMTANKATGKFEAPAPVKPAKEATVDSGKKADKDKKEKEQTASTPGSTDGMV